MEKKYISESRYKKGNVRKRRNASTVKNNLNPVKQKKIKIKKQSNKEIKRKIKKNKVNNIIVCVILLVIIAIISRAILKDENEPFIPLPFFQNSNDEVIKIGVITSDSLLDNNTSNIIINELNKYSKDMLLEINEDYSITYKCISAVNKVSNKEYNLVLDDKSKITANNIKNILESYLANINSIYYNKLKNIDIITITNEDELSIKLKTDDPYFIYNLEICLGTSYNFTNYVQDNNSNENKLILNRHKDANKELPLKIIVFRYKDMYTAVEAYKEKKINVFITNSENVENILGKYEYNIKPYRNGQSVFLFGNPKSEIYSKYEARQAIAYSIDRDGIIKEVVKSKGDKIDLPYIYDNIKFKYDVYAAENLLLTNEYKKSNKVYYKTENGVKTVLELNLLVNKEDDIKVSIANKIKNNLESIGIKVNIEKLTKEKIKTRVNKGTYDLLLASVNLNNTPDISFVLDNIFINDKVGQAIVNVQNSTVQQLNKNIVSLQNILSQEVSAIGIYSDVSYLVYSKDIIGIGNISYMNLFKGIFN